MVQWQDVLNGLNTEQVCTYCGPFSIIQINNTELDKWKGFIFLYQVNKYVNNDYYYDDEEGKFTSQSSDEWLTGWL